MRDTLAKIAPKIKLLAKIQDDLLLIGVIVLTGFGAFGLGRLSTLPEHEGPLILTVPISETSKAAVSQALLSDTEVTQETPSGGTIVASKNGSVYHFPWCPGAVRIKEENKIWFAGVEEAKKAGYTPAANCKGLQ